MATAALALPAAPRGLPAKLPETPPAGVTKEGAWAYALSLFKKTNSLQKANAEGEKMGERAIEGLAGAAAGLALPFAVALALEFFPRAKKIGPAGGFQVDTEAVITLAALGIGFGAYVMDIDGGLVVYSAGIGMAGSYVGSKGRQWGASWYGKKKNNTFSVAA